ncbi:uncharacterized protein ISCGN_020754 [Ixodes scapularis]
MSSVGAVSAASSGRGNRTEEGTQEYSVVLPPLPTGSVVLNTVFLHADIKGRPYRVEEFRDALVRLALLPEVIALGAYQMNHVWAETSKSEEGKKKLLTASELVVKNSRCIVIDPSNQDVRMKVHWLLYNVADDDVRAALAPHGKVVEVAKEKWRVDGCGSVGTMTRTAVLRLKGGVTVDDIPHQLRVGGELALVVVPGRAPLCLRCQRTGHIRKECRVPRCNVYRRFGHEGAQCVRTYAAATAPVGSDEKSELLMDEADAEEAAAGSVGTSPSATPAPVGDAATSVDGTAQGADATLKAELRDCSACKVTASSTRHAKAHDDGNAEAVGDVPMDDAVASASGLTTKRTREDGGMDPAAASQEEPPIKTAPIRRIRITPKPNIPVDERRAAKPPP